MAEGENTQTELQLDATNVHGGVNTYNQIIYQSFGETVKDRANGNYTNKTNIDEIVDVVSNYPWNIDGIAKNKGNIAYVPHCYAIEYQQRYASSMTNLINSLVGMGVGASNLGETVKSVGENLGNFLNNLAAADVSGTVKGVVDSSISAIDNLTPNATKNVMGNIMNGIKNTFNTSVNTIQNPLRGNDRRHYLQPYSLLYDMTSTGLKYCFPMISNPPTFKVSNSYVDSQNETSILSANSLFSTISSLASSIASFNRDLSQFNSFLSGNESGNIYERTNVEKAKFFQYPQQTESYTITFPLFNTVKLKPNKNPVWVQNYKFILLFCMRNMIFRKDNTSFFPPLFYDLTIPGIIRQPFTYVESVNVQPQGVVRMLECKRLFDFMEEGKNFVVPVPEAWIVTITFKSLLSTSANLVISALDDSIVTAVKQENERENA